MELGQNFNISEMFTVVQIYIYTLIPKPKFFCKDVEYIGKMSCLMKLNFAIFRNVLFSRE